MRKISNWIFLYWYSMRLKEQQNSPFKMENETAALKSNCIKEIQNDTEHLWLSLHRLIYKLGLKSIQNNRVRFDKDEFGKETVLKNPVFTEREIAELKNKHTLHIVTLIGFSLSESFLYYLTASLFVPGGAMYMKIAVSVFLALLIMFALDYAFGKHFLYREAVLRYRKNEIHEVELKKNRDTRNLGYVLIVLSFVAIIFSGLSRIFFLENIPSDGLSADRLHSVQLASNMASIFTLLVTIIAAISMASLKQEQNKIAIRYRVYQSWHKAHVLRNTYTQEFIRNANLILLITEQHIEKYWQLVIELKRIYKMDTMYDVKNEQLNQSYYALISKKGFLLNDDTYRQYSSIQCAYEDLIHYGINNHLALKDKISFIKEVLKIPKDHIAEHLSALAESKGQNEAFLNFSKNGFHKKQTITN